VPLQTTLKKLSTGKTEAFISFLFLVFPQKINSGHRIILDSRDIPDRSLEKRAIETPRSSDNNVHQPLDLPSFTQSQPSDIRRREYTISKWHNELFHHKSLGAD